MATNKLIGRSSAGVGVMEEITVGTGLSLSAGTLSTTGGGTVTSVDLTMPSEFSVTGNPVTTSGTIAVTGAGTVSQYVRGDGTLANFPNSTGGGASINYYLNGSVSQGTFGGDTYYQMSKTPILGAGTNFVRTNGAGNGYIASFITDAADPSQLNIPGGNWNLEFYFQSSASGGSPQFYGEIYKVSATNVFTLVASGSANPEGITNGTTVDQYFTSISVPATTLLITDRIAVRIYVITGGRTLTLHTENGNLCEVLTTFTTGLTALNGLTAQIQNFATGTSGTDFNISSVTATHTFNLPTASASNRGALSTTDWTNFNTAYTNRITSLTTTGSSGSATLSSNILNIPTYTLAGLGGIGLTALSSTATGLTYTNTTGVFSLTSGYLIPTTASYNNTNWDTAYTNRITSLTTTGTGAATLVANVLNIPTPPAATFTSLTTTGSSGASTLLAGVLNVPTYTLSGLGGQPLATNLTSLSGLTYASASFVKMTAAGTFALDTNTYQTSLTFSTGLTNSSGTVTSNLSTGVSGGQSVVGGTAASNSLTLSSTSNATKGKLLFGTSAYDEVNNRLGIGTASPSFALDVSGTGRFTGNLTTNITTTQIAYSSSGILSGSSNLYWDNTNNYLVNRGYYFFEFDLFSGCGLVGRRTGTSTLLFQMGFNAQAQYGGTIGAVSGSQFFVYNFQEALGGANSYYWGFNNTGDNYWGSSNTAYSVRVQQPRAANIPLAIQGQTSQTGRLFIITTTSAGTAGDVMSVFPNGNIGIGQTTDATYKLDVNGTARVQGALNFNPTNTASGTTGNQTINKTSGTVNIAAAGTTVTVTNSLVSASSIVYAVIRTNDATATIKNVVPAAGSFVINLGAATTAETSIGFFVIN
jgi:hypothetical protein